MEDNAGNVQSVVAPAESQSATSQSPAPQSPSPKARKRKPLTFGATMLASALGFILSIVVVNAICILLGIIFIMAVMAGQKTTTTIDNNIAVKVDLSHPLVEQPVSELESIFSNTERPSIHQLLTAICDAKNDARVRALYLYAGNGGAISWAQSEELRNAVMDFQSSGKPVVAFGNSFSQPTYYLVSVADRVCLNPAGMVDFRGLCAETLFFKDMLDRLGISVDLIRPNNNAFKSAGETYTMTHFSEANKQQVRSYLQDIWNYAVARISLSRSISVDSLNLVADNLEAILASEAYGAGLVDTLCFESDIQNFLESNASARKTMSAVKYDDAKVKTPVADKIAVVYAEGDVMSGKGDGIQHNVYSDDFVAALKKATADSSVKAIVLRINSPGGSAIAS
ncbi:MAG: S49 family peptidase, partial [Bacteroidales bacterium]|nr:S49 family peptidase [Bacteroidales bacterium]